MANRRMEHLNGNRRAAFNKIKAEQEVYSAPGNVAGKNNSSSYTENGDISMEFIVTYLNDDMTVAKQEVVRVKNRKMSQTEFACKFCGKQVLDQQQLVSHVKLHYKVSTTGPPSFQCLLCPKHGNFPTASQLVTHYGMHKPEIKHLIKPAAVLYECHLCPKKFLTQEALGNHLRSLHKERHVCPICSRAFISNSKLILHTRSHTGEKPYKCTDCDLAFTIKANLNRHVLTVHSKRNYKCNICCKKFGTKEQQELHFASIHNMETLHSCNQCLEKFSTSKGLKLHQQSRHNDSIECRSCARTYKEADLQVHDMNMHEGMNCLYACTKCDKGFVTASLLEEHTITHVRLRLNPQNTRNRSQTKKT